MFLKITVRYKTKYSIMDMDKKELSDILKCIKFTADNSKNIPAHNILKKLDELLSEAIPE